MPRQLRCIALLAAALLLAGCGDDSHGVVLTSSVFQSSCLGPLFRNETFYPNAEDRPALQMMQLGLPGRETLAQIHAIGVF